MFLYKMHMFLTHQLYLFSLNFVNIFTIKKALHIGTLFTVIQQIFLLDNRGSPDGFLPACSSQTVRKRQPAR
jgi:hypothetical protein